MSYCTYCLNLSDSDLNKRYHDHHYGFLITDDDELFGRLILEINQAGLSWHLMLKKEDNFRKAFENFSIEKIAGFDEERTEALLQDAGIVRNKLKINAVIYNAKQIVTLKETYGSFYNWLEHFSQTTKTKQDWIKLFKKNFKFVGGEIVNEFLMSIGYLKGAHQEDCFIYSKILTQNPKWLTHEENN